MKDREEKILKAVQNQLNRLIADRRSGRVEITVELNMSQGFIGAADIRSSSRENIFTAK